MTKKGKNKSGICFLFSYLCLLMVLAKVKKILDIIKDQSYWEIQNLQMNEVLHTSRACLNIIPVAALCSV